VFTVVINYLIKVLWCRDNKIYLFKNLFSRSPHRLHKFPPGNVWTRFAQNVEPPISTFHIEPQLALPKKKTQSTNNIKVSKTDISIPDPMIEYTSKIEELVSVYKKKTELKDKINNKTIQMNRQNEKLIPKKRPETEPLIFHNNKLINKNVSFQNISSTTPLSKQSTSSLNISKIEKPIHAVIPIKPSVGGNIQVKETNPIEYYASNFDKTSIKKPVRKISIPKSSANNTPLTGNMKKTSNENMYMNVMDTRDFYAANYNIDNHIQLNKKVPPIKSSNIRLNTTTVPTNQSYLNKPTGPLQRPVKNNAVKQEVIYSGPNELQYYYPNETGAISENFGMKKQVYKQVVYDYNDTAYLDNQSLINSYMSIIQEYLNNSKTKL
jgi:hypothetical protein